MAGGLGVGLLRGMKSLKTIGINYPRAWPAAEFSARYDKGEFKSLRDNSRLTNTIVAQIADSSTQRCRRG